MNDVHLTFDLVSWALTTGTGGFLVVATLALRSFGRRGRRPRTCAVLYALLAGYAACLVWLSVALLLTPAGAAEAHVWSGLGLGGLLGVLCCAWNHPGRWRARRLAEERRMAALDL